VSGSRGPVGGPRIVRGRPMAVKRRRRTAERPARAWCPNRPPHAPRYRTRPEESM
jgi:hypothetical protein